ncbi:MAG: hypothetical protein QF864_15450 [SAR202 cluster bacterium]|nr:hypothetical protein [SAR202 cluster bacterium]
MKRIKFTKTNIEKLPHPEDGKREVKYFASNCSHLCIIVQPQPSLKKSYYAQWGKVLMQSDGTQKRSESRNNNRVFMTFIEVYWCPHTDSNREPTDYKSVSSNISSQIIIDSK